MKNISDDFVRLKKVILTDSLKIPNGVVEVLKKDIIGILNSYFDLNEESVKTDITIDDKGSYEIKTYAKARAARKVKTL